MLPSLALNEVENLPEYWAFYDAVAAEHEDLAGYAVFADYLQENGRILEANAFRWCWENSTVPAHDGARAYEPWRWFANSHPDAWQRFPNSILFDWKMVLYLRFNIVGRVHTFSFTRFFHVMWALACCLDGKDKLVKLKDGWVANHEVELFVR